MFFALGFEHTVVNMWLIPTGILSGAHVSLYDWWYGIRSRSPSAISWVRWC